MAAWALFVILIVLWLLEGALFLMIEVPECVDCLLIAIAVGMIVKNTFELHSAYCLLVGIAAFFIFMFIAQTKVGFWIITIPFSLLWGGFCCAIACFFTTDPIWMWTIFGISAVIAISTHVCARDRVRQKINSDMSVRQQIFIVSAASPEIQDVMNKASKVGEQYAAEEAQRKAAQERRKAEGYAKRAEARKIREETLRNNPNCGLPKL